MLKRAMAVGAVPFVLMLSCGDDSPTGGDVGDAGAAGQGSGGKPTGASGSEGSSLGGAGSPTGGGSATGHGGDDSVHEAGHGGQSSAAGTEAALGGSSASGASGAGGDAGASSVACAEVVGKIPPSPLFPAAAACASGCSVPPMDGTTLKPECGDPNDVPPASAMGVPNSDILPGSMKGWPCDTGWCPSATIKQLVVGGESFNSQWFESASMGMQAPEIAHILWSRAGDGMNWFALSATGVVASSNDVTPPDYEKYSTPATSFPLPGQPATPYANVEGVHFGQQVIGVDPRPGQQRVYLAYGGAEQGDYPPTTFLVGPRFGVGYGADWVFEDQPAGWGISNIQVDETGAAFVVQAGAVYRHLDAGGWERVPIPCGVKAEQLAIEPGTGIWYLTDSKSKTFYQRAADSTWTSEEGPGGRLLLGGGTVHFMNLTDYGVTHRAGSAWSTPIVPPAGGNSGYGDLLPKAAVDACWAPHYAYWQLWGDPQGYNFERVYLRWTARGFLNQTEGTGDFTDIAVVAGPDHVFVHSGGIVDVIPLR